MSVPVVNQLREALRERTRLEDDFKLKILNRINAILEQLQECDRGSLPPAAAGTLNIAIDDLNAIVREIRNPTNMTDANVEAIVEPLERRNRARTLRLLPTGRPVDGARPLSNPAPASSTGSRFWPFGRSQAPARDSTVRDRPRSIIGDDLDEDDFVDAFDEPRRSVGVSREGGKRTRRKYRNRT